MRPALELDVAQPAVVVGHLAEQHRPAVTQSRHEAAELVPGVGLGQRLGATRHHVTGKPHGSLFGIEGGKVEAQRLGKRPVEGHQVRLTYGHRLEAFIEALGQAGIAKGELGKHDGSTGVPAVTVGPT